MGLKVYLASSANPSQAPAGAECYFCLKNSLCSKVTRQSTTLVGRNMLGPKPRPLKKRHLGTQRRFHDVRRDFVVTKTRHRMLKASHVKTMRQQADRPARVRSRTSPCQVGW